MLSSCHPITRWQTGSHDPFANHTVGINIKFWIKRFSQGGYNMFLKSVDMRSRKAMVEFLINHFRYHTMISKR